MKNESKYRPIKNLLIANRFVCFAKGGSGGMSGGMSTGMSTGMGAGMGGRGGGGMGGRGGGMGGMRGMRGNHENREKRSIGDASPIIWIDEIFDSLSMDSVRRAKRQAPTDQMAEHNPDSMFERIKNTFASIIDRTKELYHKVRQQVAGLSKKDNSTNDIESLD